MFRDYLLGSPGLSRIKDERLADFPFAVFEISGLNPALAIRVIGDGCYGLLKSARSDFEASSTRFPWM